MCSNVLLLDNCDAFIVFNCYHLLLVDANKKIIHQQLLPFLETILDPRMAAYRKGYSCQRVLLRVVEDWKLALDDRKHVAAMLMDLSKAFYSLPHELIIAKLKAYGMKEEGCAFVWAYLSKLKQRVKLSGCASDWMELLKGVPQGSNLGPTVARERFFNRVVKRGV